MSLTNRYPAMLGQAQIQRTFLLTSCSKFYPLSLDVKLIQNHIENLLLNIRTISKVQIMTKHSLMLFQTLGLANNISDYFLSYFSSCIRCLKVSLKY